MKRFQQHYHALGSDVYITLVCDKNQLYVAWLFKKLQRDIVAFEKRFSRFLPGSELTTFNQRAGAQTKVSPAMRKLLLTAQDMAVETNGLYNPFILPALQKAGYRSSWPEPHKEHPDTDFTTRKLVTIDSLIVDSNWAKIPKNSALDFGGIGKGYLLDELAASLEKQPLVGYWISLGGDIICSGHDLYSQDWRIAVQSAVDPAHTIETITAQNAHTIAIATSGTTKRKGVENGVAWHHIIDPRTGKPANTDIVTATVTASTGLKADIYAKCIVLAGMSAAEHYKKAGFIQSYIVQLQDATLVRQT